MALLVSGNLHAQFEEFLKGGADDANTIFNYYMTPFMKGIGYGFNNGWYNTAKPHETLGFDLTISFNVALVPEIDQSFLFDNSEYDFTRLASGSSTATLPTFLGGNTDESLENYIANPIPPPAELTVGNYAAPSGIGEDIKPFTLNKVGIPTPVIQAGIGLVKGTELKVRWLPTISRDDFNFKYFGIGAMHSIDQWIPGLKSVPFFDLSGFVGYTTISATLDLPESSIQGSDQQAIFDVNTTTFQILASAHVAVLTGYVGLGMDNFKTTFRMVGTYDVYPSVPQVPALEDPINLEASGNSSFRTTVGARLKLAILTLHADYTIKEYNTFTFGVGFSFR